MNTFGPLHTVFSGKGTEQQSLGLVTDGLHRAAPGLMHMAAKRWAVEQLCTDSQQLQGQYQYRHDRAAVTDLPLVCLQYPRIMSTDLDV